METIAEYEGNKLSIELLVHKSGACPTRDFLEELSAPDRRKVDHLFQMMGEKGKIANREKFKKVEGSESIFEFKSFQIRLLCFFATGCRLVICHSAKKKRDGLSKSDIRFAEECRRSFME